MASKVFGIETTMNTSQAHGSGPEIGRAQANGSGTATGSPSAATSNPIVNLDDVSLARIGVRLLVGDYHEVTGRDEKGLPIAQPGLEPQHIYSLTQELERLAGQTLRDQLRTEMSDSAIRRAHCHARERSRGQAIDPERCPNAEYFETNLQRATAEENKPLLAAYFDAFVFHLPQEEQQAARERFAATYGYNVESTLIDPNNPNFGWSIVRTERPIEAWDRRELRLARHYAPANSELAKHLQVAYDEAEAFRCTSELGVLVQDKDGSEYKYTKFYPGVGTRVDVLPCKEAQAIRGDAELLALAKEDLEHVIAVVSETPWAPTKNEIDLIVGRNRTVRVYSRIEL